MKQAILQATRDAVRAAQTLESEEGIEFIEDVAHELAGAFEEGKKVLIAGNGGSLCDAMHFAEELTGFFRGRRQALPAIALSDAAHMSCVANDTAYNEVFARGVEAYGGEGDVFIGLSTSGNSENIMRAMQVAKSKGMTTVAFLGKKGGSMKGFADFEWIVRGFEYSDRVQEAHMAAMHIIIEMVERELGLAEVAEEELATTF